MLHVMSARSVACDLHMFAAGHLSVRVGDSLRRSEIVKILELRLSIQSLSFSLTSLNHRSLTLGFPFM